MKGHDSYRQFLQPGIFPSVEALAQIDLSLLRTILNVLPVAVFIVDADVNVLYSNDRAGVLFGFEPGRTAVTRSGHLLHCIHSLLEPQGCGQAKACSSCDIRRSVGESISGQRVQRRMSTMRRQPLDGSTDGPPREMHLLITTSPFVHEGKQLSLLVMEDVSELVQLRGLLPVCAWCKRVRDDENYWHSLEQYLQRHLDVGFTHGICDACAKKVVEEDEDQ